MLKDMKTVTHLKPGQKGTKRLVEKYGNALVCVRYRKDVRRGVRFKTVEIIEEERELQPAPQYRDGDIVPLAVSYSEKAIRESQKSAGGRWDPNEKVWLVPYGAIRGNADLEMRIIED